MTPRFLSAVAFVLRWETVFEEGHDGDFNYAITERDPNDPGGATKFGIDQRDHPGIDVSTLTVDQARQIYFDGEWTETKAEQLPYGIGEAVFDSAVNVGVKHAAEWLQDALFAEGEVTVSADGVIGPKTIAAAVGLVAKREEVFETFMIGRELYYHDLARQPRFAGDLQGWLNRCDALEAFVRPML